MYGFELTLPPLHDALHHLIPNLAAHWGDEELYPQQKYIYPNDPKDPLKWTADLAFTVYARFYIQELEKELNGFILQSDEIEVISPEFLKILEDRREEYWKKKIGSDQPFRIREEGEGQNPLLHRVCNSCLSTDIIEFTKSGEIFCCIWDQVKGKWIKGDCGEQPKKQGVLTKGQWQFFVDKGAPEFYLKDIGEIAAEAVENNLSCTNIFRKYKAHPYEAAMPSEADRDSQIFGGRNSLRDTCFILYDQVRDKIGTLQDLKRYGDLGVPQEYLIKIIERTGHRGATMNHSAIFELDIEDYMDICDCDSEAATSVFESLGPIRAEHKIETDFSKANRNYEFETSMIELRYKMGLISIEEAAELTDQVESKSPWKQRKEEKKELKIALASDSVAKHTQRACQWAADLGLEKITGAQLSLFFFEEGGRPDGDVSKEILKQVNENLNS